GGGATSPAAGPTRPPAGRPISRPDGPIGPADDGTGGCGPASLGPPGHASCAISSQEGNSERTCSRMGSGGAPPRDGAGAWAQGRSLLGSGAGSQGGRPDTCCVRG